MFYFKEMGYLFGQGRDLNIAVEEKIFLIDSGIGYSLGATLSL